MSVELGAGVLADLHEHAREDYPSECCGVVVALSDGSQRTVRIRNVQDEMHAADPDSYPRSSESAYLWDSTDYKKALDMWESPGNRLLAFYHSHPDHEAYFSEEDLAQATPLGEPSYPEALQIVVSVVDGQLGDTKAFRWSVDEESYLEVALEV